MNTFKTIIDEMPVIVHYSVISPSTKGATDGRHGPKIAPDEPGSIEIDQVQDLDGIHLDVDERRTKRLIDEIGEHRYQRSIV